MSNIIRILSALPICTWLLAGICLAAPANEGKIPITTSSDEARNLFMQARDLQERFMFLESRPLLEQAVAKDPNFALAYRDLAFAQPSAKTFREYFNQARALVDKVSDGERLWILGNEAGINGDPVNQETYFRQLVEAYPKDERAHLVLATFYFGQQKVEKAATEFQKATEVAPDFVPPYNMLGYSYQRLEKYPEAEKAFVRYIELNPADPNPYDSYAELLLKMGRFEESVQSYQKALVIKPDFVPSHVGIATNRVYQGRHKEAREQLQKFFDMAKDDGQRRTALFNMAMTYLDEGNYADALAKLKDQYALAEKINDGAAMSGDVGTMAGIQFEQGLYDDALKNYQASLKFAMESNLSDESKATAQRGFLYNEGRIALKKGDLETAKAKSASFSAQALESGNTFQIWLAHRLAGEIALQEKDYAKAAQEFLLGNQQDPYNLYLLALAYKGQGMEPKAQEYCTKAARFYPLLNANYAFVRGKAEKTLSEWSQK
jgi:tetratricopeptide (TPR) repeat protein